ncbi:TRAP transporter large permease [Chloroflexota bacterium]
MSPELVGVLAIVGLFILLFLRVPIAFALGFLSLLGFMLILGKGPALVFAGVYPYSSIAVYTFTVVPLFILLGHFASASGLAEDLFKTANKWVGGLPGGLVQGTILGATALGAVSGSGVASCAMVSKVTIPEMLRHGVDRKLAYGAVASAGTIAALIPPSVLMVIFGIVTETSIGRLLIAGVIPGIVAGVNFMIFVYIRVKMNPRLALSIHGITWRERIVSLKGLWMTVTLAVLVLGGIYGGIFTPTEAGGVGAFGAFLLAIRRLTFNRFLETLWETMKTTCMVFFIVVNALIFGYIISVSGLPRILSEFFATLSPAVLIASIMILYVVLGFFLDMIAALFITFPLFIPALEAAGINFVWFGVLTVVTCELGLVTPPLAMNLFVIKSVVRDAEMGEIIAGIWPFFLVMLFNLMLYILFPQLALFLPERMMG